MFQNDHTHFKKSCRFKIYYQIQIIFYKTLKASLSIFVFSALKDNGISKKIFMEFVNKFYFFNL